MTPLAGTGGCQDAVSREETEAVSMAKLRGAVGTMSGRELVVRVNLSVLIKVVYVIYM